jgi:hypothetical protein
MAKEKPAAEFRLGYVKATVWKNGDFFQQCSQGRTKTERTGKTPINWPLATS